ncbi:hypothetical protein LSM04_002843 [Trypanosoma melophagium]|uniref:uncharacterized protein n=1 Tax=Trypanosoma melophagium TaxID=715481 RepID=UPI00351A5A68|nr:hypothetical protein LSM04_002843 [Trypanosoma melophagium]
MQLQSYSSFYTQMRQAYATVIPQSTSLPTSTPASVMHTPSLNAAPQYQQHQQRSEISVDTPKPLSEMTQRTPSGGVDSSGGSMPYVISEVQQKLAAIQSRNGTGQGQNQQYMRQPQQVREEVEQQREQRQRDLIYGGPQLRVNKSPEPADAEKSPFFPAISSTSSGGSKQAEVMNNRPHGVMFPPSNKGVDSSNDDENLTPQEMAFLRVVEFSAPLSVYAQLEPGSKLVSVCDQAIAKLFPHHLVLVRPEGVAAVELVIEELCELNENGIDGALDCILQPKGTSQRQLVRIFCSDAVARGAIFKLLCARRTLLGGTK